MKHCSFSLLAWLLLGFTLGLAPAVTMAGSSPDPKNLTITTFELSERRLELPLPSSGLSKDAPRFKRVLKIDLDGEIEAQRTPVVLLDDLWDWRSGVLLRGLRGSMAIKVVAHRAPPGVALDCETELRRMLEMQLATKLREFIDAGGEERYRPRFSLLPGPIRLAGAKALAYTNRGFSDWESYVIPVTKRIYISVDFSFFANSRSAKSADWRQSAELMKETIVRGMRFEGDWIPLQKCSP